MGSLERRKREKVELGKKILASATELIAKQGLESLTIRKIAQTIEYSPRTIYLHFKDKEDLLKAIVEAGFEDTYTRMKEEDATALYPKEYIEKQVREHYTRAKEHPQFYRSVIQIIQLRGFTPGPYQKKVLDLVAHHLLRMYSSSVPNPETARFKAAVVMNSLRGVILFLLNDPSIQKNRGEEEKRLLSFINFLHGGLEA